MPVHNVTIVFPESMFKRKGNVNIGFYLLFDKYDHIGSAIMLTFEKLAQNSYKKKKKRQPKELFDFELYLGAICDFIHKTNVNKFKKRLYAYL